MWRAGRLDHRTVKAHCMELVLWYVPGNFKDELACLLFYRWGNRDYLPRAICLCCCCCSVAKLCPTLCDPMDYSTPGFPVLHYLPEFAQTHVHWVSDPIQPSHPRPPPSLALNLSQQQGLFQWIDSLHRMAKVSAPTPVLPMNIRWLISFGIDWFDLLAVQGTLKSLPSAVLTVPCLKAWLCWPGLMICQ